MSSDRKAVDEGTAAAASPTVSDPNAKPAATTCSNQNPAGPHRGPIGQLAASSSSAVVSTIGGLFGKMSEYFEMQTIAHSSSPFPESEEYEEEYYDSVDSVEHQPASVNGKNRGIFSGISNYFWNRRSQYQAVSTQSNDNNNRRNSSSVDGDHISNSSFYSVSEEENTSFCEPYPLIDEHVNGEGVYVEDHDADIGQGQGHKFVPTQLLNIITWCDKCGELIWGFYKQCLRCTYCKYTCHYKCMNDVGLDCTESPQLRQDTPEHSPQHTLVSVEDIENEQESFVFLTREELEPKIDQFNTLRSTHKETLALNEEGIQFSGRMAIHINLSRPVSVQTGCPLPDICISTLKQYEHSIDTNKRRTTFFLPKATTQELNITCYTTAQDVIRNVLAQLQLIDNPRKFALFERTEHNGEVFMRKLVDEDKPLYMCLGWVKATGTKKFELRENETGVIEWEAFTVPELQNFLRILDKEEEDYIRQVRRKYLRYQSLLQEAVDGASQDQAQSKTQPKVPSQLQAQSPVHTVEASA